MKTLVLIISLASLATLSSCSLRLNADGSKDVSVDAEQIIPLAIKILAEK